MQSSKYCAGPAYLKNAGPKGDFFIFILFIVRYKFYYLALLPAKGRCDFYYLALLPCEGELSEGLRGQKPIPPGGY